METVLEGRRDRVSLRPKEVEGPSDDGTTDKMLSDGRQGHSAVKTHQADLGSILALNLGIHFALLSIHSLICKMGMIARALPRIKDSSDWKALSGSCRNWE